MAGTPATSGAASPPRCRSSRARSPWRACPTLFVLVPLTLCPAVTLGQTSQAAVLEPLDLESALRLALEHNPRLAAARDGLEQARAAVREARAPRYPRVDLSGAYLRIQDPPVLTVLGQSLALGRHDGLVADLGASQVLYSAGGVAAGVRTAEATEQAVEHRVRGDEEDLALQVYRSFYRVLVARRLVEIRRASLEQLQAHLAATRAQRDRGTATEYEVLRAEVELGNHRPLLVTAEHQVEAARDALTRLLGLDPARPVDVVGELSVEPWNRDEGASFEGAVASRPEVADARSREAAATARVDAARAAGRPSVSWFAHLFVTSPEYLMAQDAVPRGNLIAGVAVRVPLFTGFAESARRGQAAADLARARSERRAVEQQVAFEVRQAYRALDEADATLAAQRQVVEQAERAVSIARVRYENGLGTELEVTDAQVALDQARVVRLEAVERHVLARAALRRARGESLLREGGGHEE